MNVAEQTLTTLEPENIELDRRLNQLREMLDSIKLGTDALRFENKKAEESSRYSKNIPECIASLGKINQRLSYRISCLRDDNRLQSAKLRKVTEDIQAGDLTQIQEALSREEVETECNDDIYYRLMHENLVQDTADQDYRKILGLE